MQVNIAVGYGGRQEIADAVRELLRERAAAGASLEEVAASLSGEDITEHLYTKGQPDPDLVIRTSGEQRLSGFLLWQSVHSEYYFCEVNWPAFRRVDFLRALRDFAGRERRYGGAVDKVLHEEPAGAEDPEDDEADESPHHDGQ